VGRRKTSERRRRDLYIYMESHFVLFFLFFISHHRAIPNSQFPFPSHTYTTQFEHPLLSSGRHERSSDRSARASSSTKTQSSLLPALCSSFVSFYPHSRSVPIHCSRWSVYRNGQVWRADTDAAFETGSSSSTRTPSARVRDQYSEESTFLSFPLSTYGPSSFSFATAPIEASSYFCAVPELASTATVAAATPTASVPGYPDPVEGSGTIRSTSRPITRSRVPAFDHYYISGAHSGSGTSSSSSSDPSTRPHLDTQDPKSKLLRCTPFESHSSGLLFPDYRNHLSQHHNSEPTDQSSGYDRLLPWSI
jgi:hypothetical protein